MAKQKTHIKICLKQSISHRASGRPSHDRSVRRGRHLAPSGRLEAVARSVGAARPPPGPIVQSGRPSHGRSVRRDRHPAPSGRREAVARSVGPARPPPGPIGPAGGRRTVGRSGAAATRHNRAGGGRRMVGRSGAAATRPHRGGGKPSHGRSVWCGHLLDYKRNGIAERLYNREKNIRNTLLK